MDVLQAWIIVGVPGLVVAAALFVGRSWPRAMLGYLTLAVLVATFVMVPAGGASAAVIGVITVLLVASGRGLRRDVTNREHHEQRGRLTTASPR